MLSLAGSTPHRLKTSSAKGFDRYIQSLLPVLQTRHVPIAISRSVRRTHAELSHNRITTTLRTNIDDKVRQEIGHTSQSTVLEHPIL